MWGIGRLQFHGLRQGYPRGGEFHVTVFLEQRQQEIWMSDSLGLLDRPSHWALQWNQETPPAYGVLWESHVIKVIVVMTSNISSSYRIYNLERIYKETGCHPPCRYTQFSIPINPVSTSGDFNSTTLRIQFSKSSIIQRKELLVYPLSSFIAEFGGTLGLFLGFSFLVIWDQLEKLMWICRCDNIIGLRPCQRLTHS